MKSVHITVLPVLLAVACLSTQAYAGAQVTHTTYQEGHGPASSQCPAPGARAALTAGVSDSDTTLMLPWFIADLINDVNQRACANSMARPANRGG
jgi:hypothetical protein